MSLRKYLELFIKRVALAAAFIGIIFTLSCAQQKNESRPTSGETSPPQTLAGTYDVGIIPEVAGNCPAESDYIWIYMDDEDKDNHSSLSGWTGAISHRIADNVKGTEFGFCRVDGKQFFQLHHPRVFITLEESLADPSLLPSEQAQIGAYSYSVLKLGTSCPNGSKDHHRVIDNEDRRNKNLSSGQIFPNTSSRSRLKTTGLHFCLFYPNQMDQPTMKEFPDLGVPYGVFAGKILPPSSAGHKNFWLERGTVFTDDDDNRFGNSNDNGSGVTSLTNDEITAVSTHITVSYHWNTPGDTTIPGVTLNGKNTYYYVAKVSEGTITPPDPTADGISLISRELFGSAPNPLFGRRDDGQLFIVWNNNGTLAVAYIRNIKVQRHSLVLARDGSVYGVNLNGDILHAFWQNEAWQEEKVILSWAGSDASSLISRELYASSPDPLFGRKKDLGLGPFSGGFSVDAGQLFTLVLQNNGTLAEYHILNIKVQPHSLVPARDGSVYGVTLNGHIVHAFWQNGAWQQRLIHVLPGGADASSLISRELFGSSPDPLYGLARNSGQPSTVPYGQLFTVVLQNNGTLVMRNIRNITLRSHSLVLARDGSVYGVDLNRDIVHVFWQNGAWQEETITVAGGGSDDSSLISRELFGSSPDPLYGRKVQDGQLFIVRDDNGTLVVADIHNIKVKPHSLVLARDGSVYGVDLNGDIVHAFLQNGVWQQRTITVN